jgi:hypothetical protein
VHARVDRSSGNLYVRIWSRQDHDDLYVRVLQGRFGVA